MPALLRLVAVAAALALAAAGAIYFAGSPRTSVTPPSSGPSATANASLDPTPSPYVLPSTTPNQTAQTFSSNAHPGLRVNLPAGWTLGAAFEDLDPLYVSITYGSDNHPGGGVTIRANPVLGGDDASTCPGTVSDAGAGRSVDEIAAALLLDPRLTTVVGPTASIDGRPARVLDIGISQSYKSRIADVCPRGTEPQAMLFGRPGSLISIAGDQRVRVILVEVDGVPVLILAMPSDEAFDAFVARAMRLIDGITFLR